MLITKKLIEIAHILLNNALVSDDPEEIRGYLSNTNDAIEIAFQTLRLEEKK